MREALNGHAVLVVADARAVRMVILVSWITEVDARVVGEIWRGGGPRRTGRARRRGRNGVDVLEELAVKATLGDPEIGARVASWGRRGAAVAAGGGRRQSDGAA